MEVKHFASKLFVFYVIILLPLMGSLHAASNSEPLVEVRKINSHIRIDPSFRSRTSTATRCYLRKTVAMHLDLVQREIEQLGLSLKIMDAYRPLSEQKRLWKEHPDNRYVANPKHGSRHNRGAAVDVRLVRLSDGKDLEMPTTKFSRACHRNYEGMQSEEMKKNCKLLELIMGKHGFIPLPTEWWHFDYKDWASYSVLDIAIKDLASREVMIAPDSQEGAIVSKVVAKKKTPQKKIKKKKVPKKLKKKQRKAKVSTPQLT